MTQNAADLIEHQKPSFSVTFVIPQHRHNHFPGAQAVGSVRPRQALPQAPEHADAGACGREYMQQMDNDSSVMNIVMGSLHNASRLHRGIQDLLGLDDVCQRGRPRILLNVQCCRGHNFGSAWVRYAGSTT